MSEKPRRRLKSLNIGAALALVALGIAAPASAQTAPQIAAMRAAIATDQDRNIALLQRLVTQNSGSLNIAGVKAVGEMMRAELEPLGFTVKWEDMAATGRAGHLVATRTGRAGNKRILLIGHLDTVFEPSSPFVGFKRDGDRAVGPGIGDDKGGMVVIVAALRAMKAAGTLDGANVTVYLTGDEEKTGSPLDVARSGLVAAGKSHDAALEYEGLAVADGKDMGTIARRSAASWELRTTGRTGHSSGVFRDPDLGYGAIYEMARVIDGFRALIEPNATFNVGVVVGGTPAALDAAGVDGTASGKTNIVAAEAVARGDLRTLSPEQDAKIRTGMQAVVAKNLPGTTAKLTFFESYPPMAPTPANRALMARLNQVNRDLQLPEMPELDPALRGAADSGFVSGNVATLGGLGAAGGNAHADGEWIDLASIPRQALRSAALITRLAAEKR